MTEEKLFSLKELEDMPLPEWLVTDVLIENTFAVLVGEPGVGKSFLALDWALSVCHAKSWQGRGTKYGPVAYIAAEGAAGMGARIKAWKHEYGEGRGDAPVAAGFLTRSVNMLDVMEAEKIVTMMEATFDAPPFLTVVDTMARNMVGGNENSVEDVGRFVASCDYLKERTKGTVLVIHHPDKKGQFERGSTALRGAADTMMMLSHVPGGGVVLRCTKQKDFMPFDEIKMRMVATLDSCVLKLPHLFSSAGPSLWTGDDGEPV